MPTATLRLRTQWAQCVEMFRAAADRWRSVGNDARAARALCRLAEAVAQAVFVPAALRGGRPDSVAGGEWLDEAESAAREACDAAADVADQTLLLRAMLALAELRRARGDAAAGDPHAEAVRQFLRSYTCGPEVAVSVGLPPGYVAGLRRLCERMVLYAAAGGHAGLSRAPLLLDMALQLQIADAAAHKRSPVRGAAWMASLGSATAGATSALSTPPSSWKLGEAAASAIASALDDPGREGVGDGSRRLR